MEAGLLLGTVADNNDPEQRGRVRVSCPELLMDPETMEVVLSPWCEPGAMGFGFANIPAVGSPVYLQPRHSHDGSLNQLVYTPGRPGRRADGSSALPNIAKTGEDETTGALKAGTQFAVPSAFNAAEIPAPTGSAILRPAVQTTDPIPGLPSSFNGGSYPNNKVIKTPAGLAVEMDDTAGAERIHIWHPSGAYVEINAQGVFVQRQAKAWSETTAERVELVGTDHKECIRRHHQQQVGGNDVSDVKGRRVILASEIDLQSRVNMLMEAGGMFSLSVDGASKWDLVGGLKLTSGDKLAISSLLGMTLQSAGQIKIHSLSGPTIIAGTSVTSPLPVPVVLYPQFVLAMEAFQTALLAHTHEAFGPGPGGVSFELAASLPEVVSPLVVASPTTALLAM